MIIICVMDKGTEEKVSAAVLRLWMMNVAVFSWNWLNLWNWKLNVLMVKLMLYKLREKLKFYMSKH